MALLSSFGLYSGITLIPSEADVFAFLSSGCVLRGEFRWKRQGKNRWKAEAALEDTYDGARVKIVGTFNPRLRNISFALIWGGCRVRGLDVGGPPHEFPAGVFVETPHKHTWSERRRDTEVYRPTDITAQDLRGIFEQFLTESNVRFEGSYRDAIDQVELL